jgi:hypothetical protein
VPPEGSVVRSLLHHRFRLLSKPITQPRLDFPLSCFQPEFFSRRCVLLSLRVQRFILFSALMWTPPTSRLIEQDSISHVDTPGLKIVGPPAHARRSPNPLMIYLLMLLSAVGFSAPGFPLVPMWFRPAPVFHGVRAQLRFWSQRWRGNFSLDL